MEFYKYLERGIFAILILLLTYLFTQIHEIIEFIQKFYRTSKSIREKSTIKGATPLEIETREESLRGITQNYNYLLNKIDSSITYADKSIKVSIGAVEEIEQNIEDFMELIATMEDKKSDELFKKEDKVIDSLETLISLKDRLNILRKNLKELITTPPN
jgi:DNA-binding ferritin-like protein